MNKLISYKVTVDIFISQVKCLLTCLIKMYLKLSALIMFKA